MKTGLNNTIYSDEEILQIAQKMHEEYELVFLESGVPRLAVTNLARSLSGYPQTQEKRLMTLEYAARIKYEIQNYVNHVNYKVSKDPKYFHYKKNEFAVKQAVNDMYGLETEEELPKLIKYCVGNALFSTCKEYDFFNKKLTLKNK